MTTSCRQEAAPSRAAAGDERVQADVVLTAADRGVELHGDRQPDPSGVEVEPRPRVRRSSAEVREKIVVDCSPFPPFKNRSCILLKRAPRRLELELAHEH